MRKALVKDGKVINVIEWSEEEDYTPPIGTELVDGDGADMGSLWDGTKFTLAPAQEVDPRPARLAELKAKGWDNLTILEQQEAQRLMFEL